MPYAHLERCSACSVFCSRGCPATDAGFRHIQPSHNRSSTGIRLIYDRSSARPPCPQVLQCQPRVAKPSSIIPSPRPPCPQVLQWHPGVPNNHTISLKPASNRPQTGPRPVLATATLPTGTPVASRRGKTVIYHPFATATLPTGTPVPSPRAEQSNNLSQTGL